MLMYDMMWCARYRWLWIQGSLCIKISVQDSSRPVPFPTFCDVACVAAAFGRCEAENKEKRQFIADFNSGDEAREQALERRMPGENGVWGNGTPTSRRCCARKILSELDEFKAVLNRLEEVVKKSGHLSIFLPK